jgi:hypothetical protein
MTDALAIAAVLGLGIAFGWWLEGRASSTRKLVFRSTWLVLGAPVVLFLVANAARSDTLAMLAGLSLMALLAVAVPLGIGVLVGGRLGRSRRAASDSASTSAAPIEYIKDTPASQAARVPSSQQRGLLLIAAGVASGFWIMLALGFRLHDQPIPLELDQGVLPAAVVLIVTVSLAVRAIWRRRSHVAKPLTEVLAEREAWVAAMTPKYDLDPRATGCCEHLAPIESAMRATGIRMRLEGPQLVRARCRVDAEALARKFALPASVAYQEWYAPDRSVQDPPQSLLYCEACPSKLWVLHASEGSLDTPTFPSGP